MSEVIDIASRRMASEEIRDAALRLLNIATRRYARFPGERAAAARNALLAALELYASETSPGEAAMVAGEGVAILAARERREGRRS